MNRTVLTLLAVYAAQSYAAESKTPTQFYIAPLFGKIQSEYSGMDLNQSSMGVQLGCQATPHIAAELLLNKSQAHYNVIIGVDELTKVSFQTRSLLGVYSQPFAQFAYPLHLNAKLGVTQIASLNSTYANSLKYQSSDKTSLSLGVGLSVDVHPQVSIALDYLQMTLPTKEPTLDRGLNTAIVGERTVKGYTQQALSVRYEF